VRSSSFVLQLVLVLARSNLFEIERFGLRNTGVAQILFPRLQFGQVDSDAPLLLLPQILPFFL